MTALQPLIEKLRTLMESADMSADLYRKLHELQREIQHFEDMSVSVLDTNRRIEDGQRGRIESLEQELETMRTVPVHQQVADELEWLREALPARADENGNLGVGDLLLFLTHRAAEMESDPLRALEHRRSDDLRSLGVRLADQAHEETLAALREKGWTIPE